MNLATQLLMAICTFGNLAIATSVFADHPTAFKRQRQENAPSSVLKDNQWVTIAPSGARASFEMPKKPRYIERSFSPVKDEPPIKVRVHMTTVNEGLTTFVFGYHDLHETPESGKKANEVLDGAVKGSIANVLGRLVSGPKKITFKKVNPGREFVYACVQNKKKYIVSARVLLVRRRQYQISCLMEESVFSEDVANQFLNSLRIFEPESDLPPRPGGTK